MTSRVGSYEPKNAGSPRELEQAARILPWSLWRECGPGDTSISDVWPPELGENNSGCFKPLLGGTLLWQHQETSIAGSGVIAMKGKHGILGGSADTAYGPYWLLVGPCCQCNRTERSCPVCQQKGLHSLKCKTTWNCHLNKEDTGSREGGTPCLKSQTNSKTGQGACLRKSKMWMVMIYASHSE